MQSLKAPRVLRPGSTPTEATTATEKELHACLQKLAKVKVIDTHDHILSAYDRQIAVYATEQFNRQGINLVLNCRVSLLPRPACTQVALQLIQSAVLLLSVGDEPRTPGFRHLSCWHAQATCFRVRDWEAMHFG